MRWTVPLELAVFLAVALVAAAGAPAHAGWFVDADGLAAAATLSPVAGHGPAAILVGGLAALIPLGELAFRVALVGGVALAAAAAGVVALTRALTPTAAGAGALAATSIAIAPAAGLAMPTGEAALVAALTTWILVAVVRGRRAASAGAPASARGKAGPESPTAGSSEAAAAAVGTGALVALEPLAALVLAVVVAATLGPGRGRRGALALLALGLTTAALLVLPLALRGGAPALADAGPGGWRALLSPFGPDPAGLGLALGRLGDGAGAVLVLAGLLGLGLGAATGLTGAGWCLATAGGLALAAGAGPGGVPLAALAVLAAGLGPLTAAIARLAPGEGKLGARPTAKATRGHVDLRFGWGATIAAVPVAVIAALAPRHDHGPERTDAVAQVAADLLAAAPPGPGVVIVVEPAIHGALRVEQVLGGLRPDLALARRDRLGGTRALAAIDRARPELHTPRIDDTVAGAEDERLAVGNLRAGLTVVSDRAGFGRLDPRLAHPAGRGYALTLAAEPAIVAPPPPPRYPGPTGARLAGYLAVERARFEAGRGRLEAAARAAGLTTRFGAADLAMLDGAVLDRRRPALIGFLPDPPGDRLPPPWLADLLGDDLAWVAGLPPPTLDDHAPLPRRLHALWRAVLAGSMAADDPSLQALGVAAARATARMLGDLGLGDDAERAARALLAHVEDPPTLLVLGSILAERGGIGSGQPLTDAQRPALDEARRILDRAVAADRRSVDALIVRGLVLHRLGSFDLARDSWLAADALAPGRADLADLLGRGPSAPPATR